jgi:hypothetical protein
VPWLPRAKTRRSHQELDHQDENRTPGHCRIVAAASVLGRDSLPHYCGGFSALLSMIPLAQIASVAAGVYHRRVAERGSTAAGSSVIEGEYTVISHR